VFGASLTCSFYCFHSVDYDATTYSDICLEESKLELRNLTVAFGSSGPAAPIVLSSPKSSTGSSGISSPRAADSKPMSFLSSPVLTAGRVLRHARQLGLSPLTLQYLARQQSVSSPAASASPTNAGASDKPPVAIQITAPTTSFNPEAVLKHACHKGTAVIQEDDEPRRVLQLLCARPTSEKDVPSFRDALCSVLSTTYHSDATVHGIALRVLWVWTHGTAINRNRKAAARQFTDICVKYCDGLRFSSTIRAALFAILTSRLQSHLVVGGVSEEEEGLVIERGVRIAFHMAVSHELVWEAILRCLVGR
jgi:hypothetical protein